MYEYELLLATKMFHLLRDKIICLSDSIHDTVQGDFVSSKIVQSVAHQTRFQIVY
jgi:hypothetical protein